MSGLAQYMADYLDADGLSFCFFTLCMVRCLFAILSTFTFDPFEDQD